VTSPQGKIEEFIAESTKLSDTNASSNDSRDERFEALALEVFRFQVERCAPYQRLCENRGCAPATVRSIQQIPALPTDAFKRPLFGTASNRPHVFLSSGTTAGEEHRSRHELTDLSTYRLSALTHFRATVMGDRPEPMAVVILGPTADTHPQSSLGQMYSWCAEEFSAEPASVAFTAEGKIDLDAAIDSVALAASGKRPVLLLAISSALTALFEEMRRRNLILRLPAESRIVDTGGAKGARVMSAKGLLKASWRRLHVPAYSVLNEYGMTEMLSQFYDDAWLSRYSGQLMPRSKVGPPWCKTTILDPTTLQPVADGEVGLLSHFDLANWETISCLLTLDLGRQRGRGFEMLGRAPAAEARGCSNLLIAIDDSGSPHSAES
jgi:hypothetical protein